MIIKTPESGLLSGVLEQGQKDLNPRHAVLETAALPTELYPYVIYIYLYDFIIIAQIKKIVKCFFEKNFYFFDNGSAL